MLDTIGNKKWSKLSKVKSDDMRDRSAPNLHVRDRVVIPEHSPLYRQFLDQINNKKWSKLQAVKQENNRDRSAPNLALWKLEHPIDEDYEKRYEKSLGKNTYRNDFFWPMPSEPLKPSSSSHTSSKRGHRGSSNYDTKNSAYSSTSSAVPLSHVHGEINSAFPIGNVSK
jgi:hypothetical protein